MRARRHPTFRGFTLIELLVALFITAIIFAMGYGAINQALKDRQSLEEHQDRLTAVQNAMRVMVQDFTQLTPRPVRDVLGQGSLPCLMGSPNGISLTAGALSQTEIGGSSGGLGASSGLGTGGGGLGASGGGLGGSGGGASGGLGSSFASSSSSSSSSASSSSSEDQSSGSGALDLIVFTRAGWANPAGIQRPALARVAYRLENGVLRRVVWPELDVAQATTPIVRDVLKDVKAVRFRYMTDAREWIDQWPPPTALTSVPGGANPLLRMRPLAVEVTLDLGDWGTVVRIIEVPT